MGSFKCNAFRKTQKMSKFETTQHCFKEWMWRILLGHNHSWSLLYISDSSTMRCLKSIFLINASKKHSKPTATLEIRSICPSLIPCYSKMLPGPTQKDETPAGFHCPQWNQCAPVGTTASHSYKNPFWQRWVNEQTSCITKILWLSSFAGSTQWEESVNANISVFSACSKRPKPLYLCPGQRPWSPCLFRKLIFWLFV